MSPSSTVNVAEFLYTRLRQLGLKDLHGVPGDFNLLALDFVEPCGLTWVGNCNELNAGQHRRFFSWVRAVSLQLLTSLAKATPPTLTVESAA